MTHLVCHGRLNFAYIRRRRNHIAKVIEGRSLLEECRGAERRSGSSSRQMWWQQEMDLEEDDAGAGGQGVFPRRFYDEEGQEILEPPDAAPEDPNRDSDLDEQAPPTPPTGQ